MNVIDLLRGLPRNCDHGEKWFESENYYPMLASFSREFNPKSILEVGVRSGYSAISFLSECDADLYVGLDYQKYIVNSNSDAACNLEFFRNTSGKNLNFELVTVDTQFMSDLGFLAGRSFDLVYVDGDHSEIGAFNDLCNFWGVLNVGGHLLVDDSVLVAVRCAIKRFLTIVNEPNYEVATHKGTWVMSKTREFSFPLMSKPNYNGTYLAPDGSYITLTDSK